MTIKNEFLESGYIVLPFGIHTVEHVTFYKHTDVYIEVESEQSQGCGGSTANAIEVIVAEDGYSFTIVANITSNSVTINWIAPC